MTNYFRDNPDLVFHLEHLDLEEEVAALEDGYAQAAEFDYAPRDYPDALDSYGRVLDSVGRIAAEFVAPRAARVESSGEPS